MKLFEREWRDLCVTGCRGPLELTERSPWVILKRAMGWLSIGHYSRVCQPMYSCMLVMLDVLLSRRRHNRLLQHCILSILYEPLFSTPGQESQTLQQYSTWGRTKPVWALAFKVDEFTCKFLLRKPTCGMPWLLSCQCIDSTWDLLRTIYLGFSRDQPPLVEWHAGNKYVGLGF